MGLIAGAAAALKPLLLPAGIGMMAVGQIQAGRMAAAQAEGQQAMMDYNAALQEREAERLRELSIFEQTRQAKRGERIKSTMLARMGKAGVVSTVGTPLLVQAEQAAELELENLMIGYEGQVGVSRAKSAAAGYRMQGEAYGAQAKSARAAGYLGAGTTLLTGFSTMGAFDRGVGNVQSLATQSQGWLTPEPGWGFGW